jgi:adenosine deaminase
MMQFCSTLLGSDTSVNLLTTCSIGHGYALKDYPELMKIVKEKKIALEVISFLSTCVDKTLGVSNIQPDAQTSG